jgi:hypothetical protein
VMQVLDLTHFNVEVGLMVQFVLVPLLRHSLDFLSLKT